MPLNAPTSPLRSPPALSPLLLLASLLAACVPTLLAYNQPPSATLINQCLALTLWGGVVLAAPPTALPRASAALLAALGLVALAALGSWGLGSLPLSLAGLAIGLLAGAALLVATGANAAQGPQAPAVFAALAAGLLAAGLLGAAVAGVQVFAPGWTDGQWIAHSGLVGRAVGNLRQPNHLCSLLLWALVAAVALHELRWLSRSALWALASVLVLAIELTASRTGAVGLGLLLVWALVDRRLSRNARWLLAATPLLYALAYGAMTWYGDFSHQALGAGARLAAEGASATRSDSPNSRLNIWHNTLTLIAVQPWLGIGFGEFNLAWTLSAFPNRPTAFFDHSHNLLLQLAVELGLPLATLVLGLLGWALWQGGRRARRASGDIGAAARASWMLVLIAALHSLLEYPLWYAYFLLPTALVWGFVLGVPAGPDSPGGTLKRAARHATGGAAWGLLAGLLMSAAGAWALLDYQRIVAIYAPKDGSGSLAERIGWGQLSPLFAHHADYAAATNAGSAASVALGFARAPHSLLDTRLMMAWASHLAASGQTDQVDRARWLAQRLREFRNVDAEAFFAPCADGGAALFQCQAPRAHHDWREFAALPPGAVGGSAQRLAEPIAPLKGQGAELDAEGRAAASGGLQ
jgi:O-antigen ligase